MITAFFLSTIGEDSGNLRFRIRITYSGIAPLHIIIAKNPTGTSTAGANSYMVNKLVIFNVKGDGLEKTFETPENLFDTFLSSDVIGIGCFLSPATSVLSHSFSTVNSGGYFLRNQERIYFSFTTNTYMNVLQFDQSNRLIGAMTYDKFIKKTQDINLVVNLNDYPNDRKFNLIGEIPGTSSGTSNYFQAVAGNNIFCKFGPDVTCAGDPLNINNWRKETTNISHSEIYTDGSDFYFYSPGGNTVFSNPLISSHNYPLIKVNSSLVRSTQTLSIPITKTYPEGATQRRISINSVFVTEEGRIVVGNRITDTLSTGLNEAFNYKTIFDLNGSFISHEEVTIGLSFCIKASSDRYVSPGGTLQVFNGLGELIYSRLWDYFFAFTILSPNGRLYGFSRSSSTTLEYSSCDISDENYDRPLITRMITNIRRSILGPSYSNSENKISYPSNNGFFETLALNPNGDLNPHNIQDYKYEAILDPMDETITNINTITTVGTYSTNQSIVSTGMIDHLGKLVCVTRKPGENIKIYGRPIIT